MLADYEDHLKLIETARGERPADLFLRGGTVANVYSGELHEGATHPPPTGRFGLQLTMDGHLGQPQRLSECELVRAWLDERPDALGLERPSTS